MGRPVERKSDGELERHNNTAATVNFLLNYEFYDGERKDRPIVVIGPAAGSRVTMLRVYAYGGLIGQIATRRADFSHLAEAENDEKGKKEERADLAEKGKNDKGKDYAYPKYLGEEYFFVDNEIDETDRRYLQYMEEKYVKSGEENYRGLCQKLSHRLQDILNAPCPWQYLDKPEYLDLILKAAEKKFMNGSGKAAEKKFVNGNGKAAEKKFANKDGKVLGKGVAKKGGDLGERRLQTAIVKQHMKKAPEDGWCVVDMEYTFDKKQSSTGKIFKPDIVVFDQNNGFGFIELKYKDMSAKNLDKHYTDFQNVLQSREKVKKTMEALKNRGAYLWKYDLISDAIYQAMKASDAPKLWQGFLFVGGSRENAVRFAKSLAEKYGDIAAHEDCRFAFFPYEEGNSTESIRNIWLDFHSMQPYGPFTGTCGNE